MCGLELGVVPCLLPGLAAGRPLIRQRATEHHLSLGKGLAERGLFWGSAARAEGGHERAVEQGKEMGQEAEETLPKLLAKAPRSPGVSLS